MLLTYFLFPVGLVLLIKGAGLLVDGASSIARKLGISALVIGLTIVALGTSAPELLVNVYASAGGNTDIAIGNILGSNIANILLILGISAVIFPLAVKRGTVWKEIPLGLLAVLVVAVMANDALLEGGVFSGLARIDGIILLAFFIIFLYYTYSISRAQPTGAVEPTIRRYSLSRACLMVVIGLAGLILGGKWIVDAAVSLATALGVSQALIGLTIVAVGTSLPELATSAVAAHKKNADIAVGNVVGSNIFNVFFILGVSAFIKPLPFSPLLMRDMVVTVLATALLFVFMFVGKRHLLERWQGVCFIAFYMAYVAYLIVRG